MIAVARMSDTVRVPYLLINAFSASVDNCRRYSAPAVPNKWVLPNLKL